MNLADEYLKSRRRISSFVISLSPAFKGRHDRVALNQIDARTAISLEHNFVYGRLPKAANSTVIATLSAAMGSEGAEFDIDRAKSSFLRPSRLKRPQLDHVLASAFKFTICRNPYTRVLSSYLDKVHRGTAHTRRIRAAMGWRDEEVTFDQFLDYLTEGGLRDDGHWAPQAEMLYVPPSKQDYIGKMESLERDLIQICQTIFGREITLKNWRPHATSAKAAGHAALSVDQMRRIYALYEIDFDAFSYAQQESQ